MTGTVDVHNLVGAYVVDAVSETERKAFERRLEQCAMCADEAAELRTAQAQLALAVAEQPPPQLRNRVLAAVTTVRPAPPIVLASETPDAFTWRLRRMVLRAGIATAAAAAVAAVIVLGQPTTPPDRSSAGQTAVAAVRTAQDAEIHSTASASGATAMTVVSRSHGQVVLAVEHLPALSPDQVYQVWFVGPRGPQSAGLLHLDDVTSGAVLLAVLPADTDRVGITTEPAGGSLQPTTPNVIRVGIV